MKSIKAIVSEGTEEPKEIKINISLNMQVLDWTLLWCLYPHPGTSPGGETGDTYSHGSQWNINIEL